MAKNIATRPTKESKIESLLGTHHGYTISLRSADPIGNQRSAGKQFAIEGPKNEALIQHLRNAGARWDGAEKVWAIAKSKSAKLSKIIEQLPEILAGRVAVVSKEIEAVEYLLRPLAGYEVNDQRWHGRIAVEISANGSGLTILADIGPRTAEKFLEIGCKQDKDQSGHKRFWLPFSKHGALNDLIEELPSIWEVWAEEKRKRMAAVVGTYGAYTVTQGAQGLVVKGPFTDLFRGAMNALRGYWDRTNQHWVLNGDQASGLRAVMPQIQKWHAEDVAAKQKVQAKKEAARMAKVAAKEAEDQQLGRIYITERNVWESFELPRHTYRNGRLYKLEAQTYAGPEYGDDGDWMVSGSYLPASEEEQAKVEAEIMEYEAEMMSVKAAKAEIAEIARGIAVENIRWLPSNCVKIFSSPDAMPFCSIYLTDPGMAATSFQFSDYSTEHTGPITEDQVERIKELAGIIAQGNKK